MRLTFPAVCDDPLTDNIANAVGAHIQSHYASLLKEARAGQIVYHVRRDSTAIEAREAIKGEKSPPKPEPSLRSKSMKAWNIH